MAAQGASLQNYNNELVKCIEDLREKREEINRQILKEEEEKAKIQKDLSILTARLQKLNESLTRKQQARNEYDRAIQVSSGAACAAVAVAAPRSVSPAVVARRAAPRSLAPPAPRQETEGAYMKILESSQTLLQVLKKESTNLHKKRQASS